MRRLLLAASLALVVLAGCGGDDEPEAMGPSAREQFVTRADAVCARTSLQVRELAERTFGTGEETPSRAEQRAYDAEVERLQRANLAELLSVPVPGGDEALVRDLLTSLEAVLEEQESEEPGAPSQAAQRYAALAQQLGLRACSGG